MRRTMCWGLWGGFILISTSACEQILGLDAIEPYEAVMCAAPADCPDPGNECVSRTCDGGVCGTENVPSGTAVQAQTSGDCKVRVCDGEGGIVTKPDDTDVPDTGNDCTVGSCASGALLSTPVGSGAPCDDGGGVLCDGEGACVECLAQKDCPSGMGSGGLCDVASGLCVECLMLADCALKPGTMCSGGDCVCPVSGQDFCAADAYGPARCVDLASTTEDCGSCGHHCFGACAGGACVDAWEPTGLAGAPSPRAYHVAVWTGALMIVWGGKDGIKNLGDGAMYDPDTRVWTKMSDTGAPIPRRFATAVWTGSNMLVWGGVDDSGPLGDGGVFDPVTNSWAPLPTDSAPSPRYQHTAVWTGDVLKRMIVWGGYDGANELDTGASYDVVAGLWSSLGPMGSPTMRRLHSAVWDGQKSRMIVFGGFGLEPATSMITILGSGGIYGPLPPNEAWMDVGYVGTPPFPRQEHSAVWAGTPMVGPQMIVWGGYNSAVGLLAEGARFDAAGNGEWSGMFGMAPSPRRRHSAVYVGAVDRMVVWGGYGDMDAVLGDGGVYDVASGAWAPTGLPKGPAPSVDHTAVAAGDRVIVWGGLTTGNAYMNAGGVLDMTKVP